ncbi:MAG: aldolase/citrate lyase family protein [Thiomonas sp.]
MDWIQITNNAEFAALAQACGVGRIMVDLERLGKQARQGGLGTFISDHRPEDIARVRAAVPKADLIVRINPLHAGSGDEIGQAIAAGANTLMLPMFEQPDALQAFLRHIAGRARGIALLETRAALESLPAWATLPGLDEIYVGLNDLHRQLGARFMFEPLGSGVVDRVAQAAHAAGKRFGFGGIARLDEGLLPGRVVLAEHLRLGSSSVILSRTFNREMVEGVHKPGHAQAGLAWQGVYRCEIARLRHATQVLATRTPDEVESDRLLARDLIAKAAAILGESAPSAAQPTHASAA